jgi:YVTN family beta-propeller protein/YD repeat-containing protein
MIHRPRRGPGFRRSVIPLSLLLVLLLSAAPASADVVYLYDPLGRLVRVIDETGQAATYIYDPVGNILQIARQTAISQDQTSISTVDPPSGAQGTQVTLTFTGTNLAGASLPTLPTGFTFVSSSFSVSGNQDVLTVTLALDAELALGAHPLTLQSALGGATSLPFTLNVVLPPPRVDRMIPPIVTTGNLVQVEGNGFDAATPSQNQVTINGVPLPLVSVSSKTKLIAQILPGVTTGPVQVTTPQGTGASATPLTVVPGTHPQQNQVTATLPSLFRGPNRFGLSPDGTRAYVLNTGFSALGLSLSVTGTPVPGSVSVIDTIQSQVLSLIPVGRQPTAMTLTPDGSRVLVTNASAPFALTVIDAVTQSVIGSVSFTTPARDVVASPDGTKAYVAIDAPAVAIVDLQTLTETARITTSVSSLFLAITPDGNTVYAAGSNVFVIDTTTRQIVRTITDVFAATSVALDPVAQRLYTWSFSGGQGAFKVVDLAAGTILRNTLTTGAPAVALSPDRTRAYFVGGTTLTAVNTATLANVGTVTVGSGRSANFSGQAVLVSPDGGTVWVANASDNTVSVVAAQALAVVTTVPVGFVPGALGLLPDRSELYALNSASATVSVLDTATNELLQTALDRFGLARPLGLVVPADSSGAYVANSFVATTTAFAPATGAGLATLLLGDAHAGIHLAPALSRNELFVGASTPPGVAVLSLSTRAQQAFLPLARAPRAMALSLDERRLYVVSDLSPNVGTVLRAFDTATRAQLVQLTLDATLVSDDITLNPEGTRLYVLQANQGATPAGLVRVIDTTTYTQVTTIAVGSQAVRLAFTHTGGRLWAVNSTSISVIDPATNQVVATIPIAGGNTNNVVFTLDGSKAYVAGNGVKVVNTATNTVTTSIAAGFVRGVALSPDGQRLLATREGSPGAVSVINTATDQILTTLTVGTASAGVTGGFRPVNVTFSPDGARAWVANTGDDTLSVIE